MGGTRKRAQTLGQPAHQHGSRYPWARRWVVQSWWEVQMGLPDHSRQPSNIVLRRSPGSRRPHWSLAEVPGGGAGRRRRAAAAGGSGGGESCGGAAQAATDGAAKEDGAASPEDYPPLTWERICILKTTTCGA
mmetsp:Transcript_30262/g.49370  ORF Transcript_30262/g.49370 Transcript_30262/m.49370 type:complete len:133 (+) Transcript_30262:363-761(+)